MTYSKLKILFYLTIGLALLFAPVFLEISQDGKAYALGFLGSSGGNGNDGSSVAINPTEPGTTHPPVSNVPEPATLLLFGAGAVGLAALRKKFRKK